MSYQDPFDPFKPKLLNKDNIIIPDSTPFSNQYLGEIQYDAKGKMIKLPKRTGPELTDEIPKSFDPEYREKISKRHYYLFSVFGVNSFQQTDDYVEAVNMAIMDLERFSNYDGFNIVGIFDKTGKQIADERRIGKLWERARKEKGRHERHKIKIISDITV